MFKGSVDTEISYLAAAFYELYEKKERERDWRERDWSLRNGPVRICWEILFGNDVHLEWWVKTVEIFTRTFQFCSLFTVMTSLITKCNKWEYFCKALPQKFNEFRIQPNLFVTSEGRIENSIFFFFFNSKQVHVFMA